MANLPSPDSKDDEYVTGDSKILSSRSGAENLEVGHVPRHVMQAPELVAKMSQEERIHAENNLRRKIDFRLLPMVIIM
jgi:hypothetical protein